MKAPLYFSGNEGYEGWYQDETTGEWYNQFDWIQDEATGEWYYEDR